MSRIIFKLKRIPDPTNLTQTAVISPGEHFAKESDGSIYYKHHDTGLVTSVASGSGEGSVSVVQKFGLFITDIEPLTVNCIVNKTFDGSQNNRILTGVESDSTLFRVSVTAFSTDSLYKPTVLVAGISTTLTELSVGIWTGYADITINSNTATIHAVHVSGTDVTFTFNKIFKPVINSTTRITSVYPTTFSVVQTQVKENDLVTLQIFADQQFKKVRIIEDANNLCKAVEVTIATTSSYTFTGLQANNTFTTSEVGENLGIIFQIQSINNTWSVVYNTRTAVVTPVNARDFMKLSNLKPVLTITDATVDEVVYPSALAPLGSLNGSISVAQQYGVKNAQYCQIKSTAVYHDSVVYENTLNQLTIPLPTIYSTTKTIQCNFSGNNFTNPNLTLKLRRHSNGTEIIKTFIIKISNTAPQYTIERIPGRFRSGGYLGTTPQEYSIKVNSSQPIHPDSDFKVRISSNPGYPKFKNTSWTRNSNIQAENFLVVHDNNLKTTVSLLAFLVTGDYSITGIMVSNTVINPTIELGGFVPRTFNIVGPAITHNLGTAVKDASKLKCKVTYYSNDNENSTYINNTDNAPQKFTILNPTSIPSVVGDVWSSNDVTLNNENQSFYTVVIEEIA